MGKRIKGFLAGSILFGALGTALGVLFAPRQGKELRKKLAERHEKGEDVTDLLKSDLKTMGSDMKATAQKLKSSPALKKYLSQGQSKAKALMNTSYDKLKDLSERAGMTVDELLASDYDDIKDRVSEQFDEKSDMLINMGKKAKKGAATMTKQVKKTAKSLKNKLK